MAASTANVNLVALLETASTTPQPSLAVTTTLAMVNAFNEPRLQQLAI